jgi:hypothetical protein
MAPMPHELSDRELLLDLHGKISTVLDTVHRHDRALHGNGRPGLVQRVDLLDERQQTCPARLAATWQRAHGRLTLYLAVLAVVVSAVTGGVALWRAVTGG